MPVTDRESDVPRFSLDDRILEKILSHYSFTDWKVRPILTNGSRPAMIQERSRTSLKLVIESGKNLFFLKELPWYVSSGAAVKKITGFQKFLYDNGIPTASLLLTDQGSLFCNVEGKFYVLSEFLNGRPITATEYCSSNAGALLGLLHNTVRGYHHNDSGENYCVLVLDHISLAFELVENKKAHDACVFLQEKYDTLLSHNNRSILLERPSYMIHGDFSPRNLLHNPSDPLLPYVVDFDNCDVMPLECDIAEALVTFSIMQYDGESTNFHRVCPISVNVGCGFELLDSYFSSINVESVDQSALQLACELTLIELLSLGLMRRDFTSFSECSYNNACTVLRQVVAETMSTRRDCALENGRNGLPSGTLGTKSRSPVTQSKRFSCNESAGRSSHLPPVVLVLGGKGGVGKTVCSAALALAYCQVRGCLVGLLDADVEGPNIHAMLPYEVQMRCRNDLLIPAQFGDISVVSSGFVTSAMEPHFWSESFQRDLVGQLLNETVWPDCEVMFVDMPPGTGTMFQFFARTCEILGAVVVTSDDQVAETELLRTVALLKLVKAPLVGTIRNFCRGSQLEMSDKLLAVNWRISSVPHLGIPTLDYHEYDHAFELVNDVAERLVAGAGTVSIIDEIVELL